MGLCLLWIACCAPGPPVSRAHCQRIALGISVAPRVCNFFALCADDSTPPHPMVVATDENFHRRTIKQFYTKPEQVGIAVASSSRP